MKLTEVLIRPIITEKANNQSEKLRRYAFKVNRKANKLEIKKAVEEFYGVSVLDVNSVVVPGKNKTGSSKLFSGLSVVSSAKALPILHLVPAVTGLNFFSAILI